jgi:hypothetical protein
VSHAEQLRDIAAWMAGAHPERGNAPDALDAAAVDIVQGAGMLRATAFLLRERAEFNDPGRADITDLGPFMRARATDIETVANRLDPTQEAAVMTDEFTVNVPRTYRTGWGVAVLEIWSGEDEQPERITAIEVEVVRIGISNVRIIGGAPCVSGGPDIWHPVDNFRDLPDLTTGDSHDLRDRWFATEQEAREHAARVRHEWDNPLPWQPFAVTS